MNMKKETKVLCPQCGAELGISKDGFTAVAAVVGKKSRLDQVYKSDEVHKNQIKNTKTTQERIDALRNAGVDVSNLFAMHGADGGDYIASDRNGMVAMLDDNDPIFNHIVEQGTVPNKRLFRRWVMAQMFHMMSYKTYYGQHVGVTGMIHKLGHEYQWKMLMDELYAQMKMEGRDTVNFSDRNRWFNANVVEQMGSNYIANLTYSIDAMKEKRCKGIPYKRINGRNIFVSDLKTKLYGPLYIALFRIGQSKNAAQLYENTNRFNNLRIKMNSNTSQSSAWVDAYKGSGAFFTMQNLIRFHNCTAIDDSGKRLDKQQSLEFISAKADMYQNGEGWRLLAVLKKMLDDNDIDINKKIAEWRNKK